MIEKGDYVFLLPHSYTVRMERRLKPRFAYRVTGVGENSVTISRSGRWTTVPKHHCQLVQCGVPEEHFAPGDVMIYISDEGALVKDQEYIISNVHDPFGNTFKTMISLEGHSGVYPPERFGWVHGAGGVGLTDEDVRELMKKVSYEILSEYAVIIMRKLVIWSNEMEKDD